MNTNASSPVRMFETAGDTLEFFRTQERAAYERWRSTLGTAAEINERYATWKRLAQRYDAELLHRASIVGRAA